MKPPARPSLSRTAPARSSSARSSSARSSSARSSLPRSSVGRPPPAPPAPPPSDARVLVVDTETTGLDPAADRVIEVGVVEVKGDVEVGTWCSLIRADVDVPARVTQITGITDAMVAAGLLERDAVDVLAGMIARVDAIVAWNAAFDRAFVAAAFERAGVALPPTPWFCALEAARQRRPDLKGYRLDLVARDLEIPTGRSHRALDDARCALLVWRALPSSPPQTTSTTPIPPPTTPPTMPPTIPTGGDVTQDAPSTGPRGTLDLFR